MEPYYSDDCVTIYCGDSLEILPMLGQFDAAFADPPYNYGFDYGSDFDDKLAPDEYVAWCGRWFDILREHAARLFITSGHGNLAQWIARKPAGIAAWYKPGNPSGAGIFQFCEWEPVFVWGCGRLGGSDVWKATINPAFKGKVGHPCPKPELLLRRIIAASKATSFVDPFMGSGTTLVAAKYLGVPSVGIERNEAYCEIAVKRLAQEVFDLGA
jgi:DNA modification methylase